MAKAPKPVPVALLNLMKLEYEAGAEIDTILDKYKITKEQLGEPEWLSKPRVTILPALNKTPASIEPNKPLAPAVVTIAQPASQDLNEAEQDESVTRILEKISSFKEKAVDYALDMMSMVGDTKELKDLISSVTAIEATYKDLRPKDNTPVINIAIQNLVDRFRDDC
nr:MAG TPA: hypothetical protein [Caudoviricetes sp.]